VRRLFVLLAVAGILAATAAAQAPTDTSLTGNGRRLEPIGRMTQLGAFPTGGALSPDGRFYWAVDAGRKANAVRVIDVAGGAVRQTLPLPGGYVGVTFAPDGRRAYVSGQKGDGAVAPGSKGLSGDVVHVYDVDPGSGQARELDPIALPNARDGAAAQDELPQASNVNAWPEGLDVTPDGKHLLVVLGQADQLAIVNLATRAATLADVGRYPYGVVADPDRARAYVTNERDGTVSVLALPSGNTVATIPVGGQRGAPYAHPEGITADPVRDRVYVAVTDRDLVAVIDTERLALERYVDVGRREGIGTAPVNVAVAPDARTLYVADAGEDAVTAVALTDRGTPGSAPGSGSGAAQAPRANRGPSILAVAPTDRGTPGSAPGSGSGAAQAPRANRRPSILAVAQYRKSLSRIRRVRSSALRRARTPAARRAAARRFSRSARALRTKYLRTRQVPGCEGPSTQQIRRYVGTLLRGLETRDRERAWARRTGSAARRRAADRRYRTLTRRARRLLAAISRDCPAGGSAPQPGDTPAGGSAPQPGDTPAGGSAPQPGDTPGLKAFDVIGRLPTASYTTDVEVTPDGKRLVWLAAKGFGSGPSNGERPASLLFGRAGVLDRPDDETMRAYTSRADRQVVPANAKPPPLGTPVVGPGGGASDKIEHVFYVVRENRTYDQIFGSEPRGKGDPRLQVFDDNGIPGPTGGVTPNAHALARRFPLLDSVYANTEDSTAGHKITAGAYANDYTQRANNTQRDRKGNPDLFPIGIPPNAFIFDQAVRQSLPFRVYGELGAGNQPFADDGRPTYEQVQANTDPAYPSQVQGTCRPAVPQPPGTPNAVRCTADAGDVGTTRSAPAAMSRIRVFQQQFQQQLSAGTVPRFNYMILFNDHTDGTVPGVYTPKANVADNDLALGQLVELVSQSPIWRKSAIFVIEDDSQDGLDSVDAHRIPAFVISPWAKNGTVVSTRYDQYSFLRTAELISGLKPLSLNDALATPLYDAFISGDAQPDVEGTRYRAIQPEHSLTEVNPAGAPNARLSASLPWDKVDYVPQRIADRILWQSVFGAGSAPPPPGPNASPVEAARAAGAMRLYRAGVSPRAWLLRDGEEEGEGDQTRARMTANLLSRGAGLSRHEAEKRLEAIGGG